MTAETITMMKEGSHTHRSSLLITAKPHRLKNEATPTGETTMGRHGKKYLVISKGDNKATPKSPFMKASRRP
jgi:hypothetical protein